MKIVIEDSKAEVEGKIVGIYDKDYDGHDIYLSNRPDIDSSNSYTGMSLVRFLLDLPFVRENTKIRLTIEVVEQ